MELSNPEIWGGIECTINRVRNEFFNQIQLCRHKQRVEEDLELISELGINKLRYPILWEECAPANLNNIDFSFQAQAVNLLDKKNIDIIAGLLHHGSGPEYTSLIDKDFPNKLENYAFQTAKKFPGINYYTPINEPLTTARFSGLYGLWYPHLQDKVSFAEMLMNQVIGISKAMKAIRKVNPDAKLIQTEDLAYIHAVPSLQYQADFENLRRWLTFDLLTGKVNKHHYLYHFLIKSCKYSQYQLDKLADNPCPPDIIGLNYYLTSERFLDDRIEEYPEHTYGGNGKDIYIDIEAVRSHKVKMKGAYELFNQAYERYNIPLAITEVHLGCTREEQVRWFRHIYNVCKKLKSENIPIKGVTAWAMLGSYNWNNLLTEDTGHYEQGAFDVRSGEPRITALGKYIRSLSTGNNKEEGIYSCSGWWERDIRCIYTISKPIVYNKQSSFVKPLLITGGTGTLGNAFANICTIRGIPYILTNRDQLDICSIKSVSNAFEKYSPFAIINTAGFVRVDDAEQQQDLCMKVNFEGIKILSEEAVKNNIKLVTFSTDMVFNGYKNSPYNEDDDTEAANVYGLSKLMTEQYLLKNNKNALVIRTSSFFGPWDKYNFIYHLTESLLNNKIFNAAYDVIMTPTYVPDLVNETLDLLLDDESGIKHITNSTSVSWYEFALLAAEILHLDRSLVIPKSISEMNLPAQRPKNSALHSIRGVKLRGLEDAIEAYKRESIYIKDKNITAFQEEEAG